MLASPTEKSNPIPVASQIGSDVYYTRQEFMDELAKQLGEAYGLNDIREAH